MLTDGQIEDLIRQPKRITSKDPALGYHEENRQRRCDLQLEGTADGKEVFLVFVRQNLEFIENFSIGMRYVTGNPLFPRVTLVRYNGPHGDSSLSQDGHFARSHIHRITEQEMNSGSSQPQERHRQITDRYLTFEECLLAFFGDAGVVNYRDYFPDLLQGRLFNGP